MTGKYENSIKHLLLWFITLSSINFYSIVLVPGQIAKGLEYVAIFLMLFFTFLHLVYDKGYKFKKNFTTEFLLFLFALAVSTAGAYYFHHQAVKTTLFELRGFYFFLLYFSLHFLKIHPEKIIKMFITLGLVYCVIYILQYFAYPIKLISTEISIDRGSLRMFIPGGNYLFTAYFICLFQFLVTRKKNYLFFILPMIVVFILLATRQVMASIALLTIIMMLFSKQIKSRVLIIFFSILCVIPIYFLFQNIFSIMFELTIKTSQNLNDNVRYLASEYYLFRYNPKFWAYIFGNGYPGGHSAYGREISQISQIYGYFQSDIGIIGDFVKFGIIFVIAQLVFLSRLLFTKLHSDIIFIRYNVLSIFMSILLGAGMHNALIGLYCMMAYLIDVYKDKNYMENYSISF